MRLIFMGTPSFAIPSLKALINSSHQVSLVITRPDQPAGRGLEKKSPPVKEIAQSYGLKILQPLKINTTDFFSVLKDLKPDLIVLVSYGKILPQELLEIPSFGAINLHPSLLPLYRGPSPISAPIINGDEKTAISIIKMNQKMDAGKILAQEEVLIDPHDTRETLSTRLADLGSVLLLKTINNLKEALSQKRTQEENRATYTHFIKKKDGLIDWTRDAREVYNYFRAMCPWPGSFTYYRQKILKVWRIERATKICPPETKPGTIITIDEKGIIIAAGKESILITEVQLEGKRRMLASDFVKGQQISVGEVLG